jgi:hypothetical protein
VTNEEILAQQVEALEKLLQLKEVVIQEQVARIDKLEAERQYAPRINVPFISTNGSCPSGGSHDYPFPWHGTTPAPCKKCNQAPGYPTFTVSSHGVASSGNVTSLPFWDQDTLPVDITKK